MKRMLFNATHAEELRVAIVDGQKLIDIDIETAGREQRKSNIYKGIITRIEPSLEACFVNYGEERHGFLPFKEISKIYFKPGVEVSRARIQDALTEGQEIIVQVEKEERGNKGAALTTFVSLAGRYLVLMPNNPRGGGVSRRVEGEDRQELREVMDQLQYPQGMSIIARTAGIGRTVEELQWDLNYLLQLWKAITTAVEQVQAPELIYLESSLVIRAIRDYFNPNIGEILIDTDDIYIQAKSFVDLVMPDISPRIKRYQDDIPLFSRFQIEHQIETAYARTVPLPSGGAIVIDHTEALVAVDVNSARATKGSDIEETALRTNLEAADEVARQLRLRDLGGLIVIDFIDMEVTKNQREVEQRLKDALHYDRARVQMGKISRFGLMELSRQRLRPSLGEGSHIACPRCNGTGVIRDTESSALHVLRIIQEEAMKDNTAAIHAQVPVDVATFLLNEKRAEIHKIEARLKVNIVLIPNKHIETPHYKLERLRHDDERLEAIKASYTQVDAPAETVNPLQQREEKAAKPRQEAVVKGITPEQPAPLVVNKPSKSVGSSVGLWQRIVSWFSGPSTSESSQEQKSSARAGRGGRGERSERGERGQSRGERHERNARGGRGRGRGERHRDGQPSQTSQSTQTSAQQNSRNDSQAERQHERSDRASSRQRGEASAQLLNTHPVHPEGSQAAREERHDQEGNRERGRRNRRNRHEGRDRNREANAEVTQELGLEQTPLTADASASSLEASPYANKASELHAHQTDLDPSNLTDETLASAESGADQPRDERSDRTGRRGRGGRGRGGRGGRGGRDREYNREQAPEGYEQHADPQFNTDVVNQSAEPAPAPDAVPAATLIAAPSVLQSSFNFVESVPTTVEVKPEAAIVTAPPAFNGAINDAITAVPAPIVSSAPQQETVATKKPVATPLSVVVQPAPMPIESLQALLAQANLQLVLTQPEKWQEARERAALEPKPVHRPRERKPLPALSTEPLVQVETRPQ